MNVIEKINKYINRNNPESIAENVAYSYEERKENGEKNPMDHTAEEIYQIIKSHPDIKRAILANILENEKIPNRIFEKVATQISKDEEIPDSVIPDAVERADTNLSSESIKNILKDGEINENDRIVLLKKVEDKESQKECVKSELKRLYKSCYEKKDSEVTSRIEEIKDILNKEDQDEDVNRWIQTVIAKKMAENYYSDIKQGTKIYTFTKILPIEKMIENDLPSAVEKEYLKIEDEREKKKNRFDKEKFNQQILLELGKQIGIKYEETGIFVVPQSRNLKKLNEEEKTKFIKTIQTYARKALTKEEIIDIDDQIRGNSNNVQIKENILINLIKKIPEKDKNKTIEILSNIISNDKTLDTISMMEEKGFIDKLNKISKNKRGKTIEIMKKVMTEREKISIVKAPKIKEENSTEKEDR